MTSFRYRTLWFLVMAGGTYYTIWTLMDIKYSRMSLHPVQFDITPLSNTSPGNRVTKISENEGDAYLPSCSASQNAAQTRVRDACKTMTENYKRVKFSRITRKNKILVSIYSIKVPPIV